MALSLSRSYISGQSQKVCINDECSSLNSIGPGVAQGWGLSPFLLIIFISGFVGCFSILIFFLRRRLDTLLFINKFASSF